MKKILALIFFGLLIGCSDSSTDSEKVLIFTETNDPEIADDYNYHLTGVIDYLDQKGIEHQIVKSRVIKLEDNSEIKIDEKEQFAMILMSPDKNREIEYRFGTDIDLIMQINEYFGIKE